MLHRYAAIVKDKEWHTQRVEVIACSSDVVRKIVKYAGAKDIIEITRISEVGEDGERD